MRVWNNHANTKLAMLQYVLNEGFGNTKPDRNMLLSSFESIAKF